MARKAEAAIAAGLALTLLSGCQIRAPGVTAATDPSPAGQKSPYGKAAGASPAMAATDAATAASWPETADCRALARAVLALPTEERARLPQERSPLALLVADGPLLLRATEVPDVVQLDLPVPATDK